MPFNLPPSWNPGFALPDNVLDEGLERRAFTTKWAPRGTYDDPSVGTGGYVVPQYVRDEGYGQGTYTTKWMPRGTYNGPRVPQWIQRQPTVARQRSTGRRSAAVTFQRVGHPKQVITHGPGSHGIAGLGDDGAPIPELYQEYGQRAANVILAAIARVASPQRKAKLKEIMDKVDPSLWGRTAAITRELTSRGLTAAQAFPTALARALSAGIAAEIVQTGVTRRAPQANSLLGLGCYGCTAALGAIPNTGLLQSIAGGLSTMVGASAPPTVETPLAADQMQVGPLRIPTDPHHVHVTTITVPVLPSTGPWGQFRIELNKRLTDQKLIDMFNQNHLVGGLMGAGAQILPAPANPFWQLFGVKPGQPTIVNVFSPAPKDGNWSDTDDGMAVPIMIFKHPVSGSKWGIFVAMMPTETSGSTMKIYPTTSVAVYAKWLPDKPWYSSIEDSILSVPVDLFQAGQKVVTGVGGVVTDAVDKLGELACGVASHSGGLNAGAAAAAAAGPGAAAGVAGAAIAATLCAKPQVPMMPLPPQQSSILPLAILGGGALVAVMLLKKNKKKKTP
jgi:hypothetical protein